MSKAPKLRFKEFSGDWKEKKFNTIFLDIKNKTSDTVKYPLYSLTIENGVVPKSERYEREFLVTKDEDNFKVVNKNEFVYNPMNLRFGALARYKGDTSVSVSGYYNVFKVIDNSPASFWDNYLKTNRMMYIYNTIATGSLIEKRRVHFTQFIELKLPVPSKEEQEKIASFFSLIDNKISLQGEKVEALKDYKKGMMQKIFSRELRFKDDEGRDYPEWEHKKLNRIVERITRKNKGTICTLPLTISAQYGLVDQVTFFNKTVASANLEGYYLLEKGEFAYNKSYSTGYPFGAIKRLDRYDRGVLSSLYICFSILEGVDSDFLVQYFETSCWHKEISMIAVEGARNHGLLNISVSDFFETYHWIPCYDEQVKIGEFLGKIDEKINKEQDMLDSLNEYKKGLLQQMFV